MKLMRLAAALAVSGALAACAVTSPVPASEASAVPADRAYAYQEKPAGEYGTLVITRDKGMTGALAEVTISVDGKRAASLHTGEKVSLLLPVGDHIISGQFVSSRKDREVILKAGQTRFYRVSIDSIVGTMDLSPTLDQ